MADNETSIDKEFNGNSGGVCSLNEVVIETGKADAPFLYAFGSDLSICQIFAGVASFFRVCEICLETFRGPFVDAGEAVGIKLFGLLFGFRMSGGFYFDAGAFGESFDGLGEGEIFAHLDEFEDVATGAAGEAFENLLYRADVHARAVVFVEWAQADEFLAFSGEADVFADNVNDIVGLLDACDNRFIRHT